MVVTEFENLLKQAIGLDVTTIGSSTIERAVQHRLAACRLHNGDDYLKHVSSSESELQELIESVVVPETWFYRDKEAFTALGKVALEEWLPANPDGILRVLSVPCSTGEEPYTMAMALTDVGLPPGRFHIDAADISARVVTQARRAIYGRNSFRGRDHAFRDQYFDATASGHHLRDSIRKSVLFHQGNLLDPAFLCDQTRYAIIFCRNLLIYFDGPTQERALQTLDRLLAPKGLLFVGPAETGLMVNHHFVSAKMPLAFAFRRAADVPNAGPGKLNGATANHSARRRSQHLPRAVKHAPPAAPKPVVQIHVAPVPSPPKPKWDVNEIERLADQGCLEEAAKYAEELMRDQGPSAKVFYLLGLVRDAAGLKAAAVEFYRKALYLDPHHGESLLHLAYLLEGMGDPSSAQVLRQRAARINLKGKS